MTDGKKTGQSSSGWHRVEKSITCPQAFAYRELLHLRPKTEKVEPGKGTVLHEGLLVWHTGGSKEAALATMRAMPERYIGSIPPAVVLLEAYTRRYPQGSEPFEVLAGEVEVEVKLAGLSFTRRIDLVVRMRADGLIRILDHKTAGRPSLRAKSAPLDWSLLTQEMVLKPQCEEMFGAPYGGFVLNLIGTQEAEFRRQPVIFSRHMMAAAPRSIHHYLVRLEELAATCDPWEYPRSGACMGRFGPCDYTDLCVYGRDAVQAFIQENDQDE